MAEISDWGPISATQLDIQAKCLGVSEKNCLLNHFLKKIVVRTRQSLTLVISLLSSYEFVRCKNDISLWSTPVGTELVYVGITSIG